MSKPSSANQREQITAQCVAKISEAISMLETSKKDIKRADRIDCLDCLSWATTSIAQVQKLIRDTLPYRQFVNLCVPLANLEIRPGASVRGKGRAKRLPQSLLRGQS